MLIVTATVAAFLGFFLVRLSLNVVKLRRSLRISVGDGDNPELLRAIRAQGNFIEYIPLSLILLACLEFNGMPWWICAVFGAVVIIGRWLHQRGITDDEFLKERVLGMQFTLMGILVMGLVNLIWLAWSLVLLSRG